jgi:hypothetical protein
MEILNFYNCKNLHEAKIKEQEHFVALKATLNSIEPLTTPKVKEVKEKKVKEVIEYLCQTCNTNFNTIIKLNKHQKKCTPVKEETEESKWPRKYKCETCHLSTRNKKDYNKHMSTAKHKKLILMTPGLIIESKKHICNVCKKEYKSNVGLWKHKKICLVEKNQEINNIIIENNVTDTTLTENKDKVIELLIKENTDFKNIILDFMKNSSDIQKQHTELQIQMIELLHNK